MFMSMSIPTYPEWTPIELSHQQEIHSLLNQLQDGISEFTFAGLYLFRHNYQYKISLTPNSCAEHRGKLIVSGTGEDPSTGKKEPFFMLPQGIPGNSFTEELFKDHTSLKNLSEQQAEAYRILFERKGYCVMQDRNNFDYLYSRKELSELSGRKFHKKRNLVNAFINNYNYEEKRITRENRCDLYAVLKQWTEEKNSRGDFEAAKGAIDLIDTLNLQGCITYVDGAPCAYSMGEVYNHGTMFAVHFEKAVGDYKGIYQFINRSFASMLPHSITYINREQDLGDQGLRQSKMSYRPIGFIKKYRVMPSEFSPCDEMLDELEQE